MNKYSFYCLCCLISQSRREIFLMTPAVRISIQKNQPWALLFFEIWNPHLVFLLRKPEMDNGRILPLNHWQVAGCQDSRWEPNSQGSGVEVRVAHPQTSLITANQRREGFQEATSRRMSEAEIGEWGRYVPCPSMVGDEVCNWKQPKDTVKWQKYWKHFVNILITRSTKINYSLVAHVLCHHHETVLLVLALLFHFLGWRADSSLPQKHSHFLFKREAEVYHCNASSINITLFGALSSPVQKKKIFMHILLLWQWGVK